MNLELIVVPVILICTITLVTFADLLGLIGTPKKGNSSNLPKELRKLFVFILAAIWELICWAAAIAVFLYSLSFFII